MAAYLSFKQEKVKVTLENTLIIFLGEEFDKKSDTTLIYVH